MDKKKKPVKRKIKRALPRKEKQGKLTSYNGIKLKLVVRTKYAAYYQAYYRKDRPFFLIIGTRDELSKGKLIIEDLVLNYGNMHLMMVTPFGDMALDFYKILTKMFPEKSIINPNIINDDW